LTGSPYVQRTYRIPCARSESPVIQLSALSQCHDWKFQRNLSPVRRDTKRENTRFYTFPVVYLGFVVQWRNQNYIWKV